MNNKQGALMVNTHNLRINLIRTLTWFPRLLERVGARVASLRHLTLGPSVHDAQATPTGAPLCFAATPAPRPTERTQAPVRNVSRLACQARTAFVQSGTSTVRIALLSVCSDQLAVYLPPIANGVTHA